MNSRLFWSTSDKKYKGFTMPFAPVHALVAELHRPKRSLFSVDGDHACEAVRDELNTIFSTVPDASALAHDTFFQSVESKYNIGPARATGEIVQRFPSRFQVIKSGLGLPGMTLLAAA